MKKAFLFLIMAHSLSLCTEEEGQIELDVENTASEVENATSKRRAHLLNSVRQHRRSKKVACRALFLALLPFTIGVGIDFYTATSSTEFRQVATAFSLNDTQAQLQPPPCDYYYCFCDHHYPCLCCSPVIFPDYNSSECRNLLYTSEIDQNHQHGVIIQQCTEEVTNTTPIITSVVSGFCRVINLLIARVIYRTGH